MESGDEAVLGSEWGTAVLLAAGPDPYALVTTAVSEAARLSGGARPLQEKRLPPTVDVFGWCSYVIWFNGFIDWCIHSLLYASNFFVCQLI